MSPVRPPVVVVVGGGVAGLASAWELVGGGSRSDVDQPLVHVLEAGSGLGGKLQSAAFTGRTIDLGADAFLSRRPEAIELCEEIGASDDLVPVGASGAAVLARGRLRPMPARLALGVPTRWLPLARSGILGPIDLLRVGMDLFTPHAGTGEPGEEQDGAVGDIVGGRLGQAVVERLVDPLIGGIHAGGVVELSAAATFPPLLAASHRSGSFMRRLGETQPAPADHQVVRAPFLSLRHSTASLIDRVAAAVADRGVTMHTQSTVTKLTRPANGTSGWIVTIAGSDPGDSERTLRADAVVLAIPAPQAASLLADHAPRAAALLGDIQYASVGIITLSVPSKAVAHPLNGTGFLVPRTALITGRPALITGCTYLSRKWSHLAQPEDELIRVSVGRYGDHRHAHLDDEELQATAFGELSAILRIGARAPTAAHVQRWEQALPQYRPGHLSRVSAIETAVGNLAGVAVAGSAFRGVGIPACIASGRAAARTALASLDRSGLRPVA